MFIKEMLMSRMTFKRFGNLDEAICVECSLVNLSFRQGTSTPIMHMLRYNIEVFKMKDALHDRSQSYLRYLAFPQLINFAIVLLTLLQRSRR